MSWEDNQDLPNIIKLDVDWEDVRNGGIRMADPVDLPDISLIPVDVDWEEVREGGK
jgi:hypothetical protein